MKESEDTSSQSYLLPVGHYDFQVIGIPKKFSSGKSTYRQWIFTMSNEKAKQKNVSMIFFPWESKDLLLAVGGIQDRDRPAVIHWDDEEVDGRTFEADVMHGKFKKKDGGEGDKYILKNITGTIPF